MKKALFWLWLVVVSMAVFDSAWVAYHLFFLAQGYNVEITEPRPWLAVSEFILSVIVLLATFACYAMMPRIYRHLFIKEESR